MSHLPPSSFSYEARALEEALWEAGAKAEAPARRDATRASFILLSSGKFKLRNCDRTCREVIFEEMFPGILNFIHFTHYFISWELFQHLEMEDFNLFRARRV